MPRAASSASFALFGVFAGRIADDVVRRSSGGVAPPNPHEDGTPNWNCGPREWRPLPGRRIRRRTDNSRRRIVAGVVECTVVGSNALRSPAGRTRVREGCTSHRGHEVRERPRSGDGALQRVVAKARAAAVRAGHGESAMRIKLKRRRRDRGRRGRRGVSRRLSRRRHDGRRHGLIAGAVYGGRCRSTAWRRTARYRPAAKQTASGFTTMPLRRYR